MRHKPSLKRIAVGLLRAGLVLALLGCGAAGARLVPTEDVRAAVETWVRNTTVDARPDARVERIDAHRAQGRIVTYIAHLEDQGYCLCGADDVLLPVYFYCPRGTFDPAVRDLGIILEQIAAREAQVRSFRETAAALPPRVARAMSERPALWRDYIAGRVPVRSQPDPRDRIEPEVLVLPLTTCWDQGYPYNLQCPTPIQLPDVHTIVGCVATATATIMDYWQWPPTGQGSALTFYHYRWRSDWDSQYCPYDPQIPSDWGEGTRLRWIPDGGGHLQMNGFWDWSVFHAAQNDSVILNKTPEYLFALAVLYDRLTPEVVPDGVYFDQATYEWDLLEDTHGDPLGPEDDEVAEICHHVGVSVYMDYGLWGSGSVTPAENALEDHFYYDQDAFRTATNMYTMTADLVWMRAVGITGAVEEGAHMWVIQGYDKRTDPDRLFLMNMGWGPENIGWYTLDEQFPIDQEQVMAIAPESVVRFVGNTMSGDGSPGLPYRNIDEALAQAPDHTTLIFKAGSDNAFSGQTLTIDRPLTLKGIEARVRPQ